MDTDSERELNAETLKMILNLEKIKIHDFDTFDDDMIKEWLDNSQKANRNFPKPTIDKDIVEFAMYSCKQLDVEDVFFMTLDVIGKYLDLIKNENTDENPILTILVLISICSKHSGQRSDISGSILSFLANRSLKMVDLNTIINTERRILMKLKCHIPLLSTKDDMDILVEFFVEPAQFIELFHKQCANIMYIFYHHSILIIEMLDDIYGKNVNSKLMIDNFYKSRLYFPAGILICALKISQHIKLLDCDSICRRISHYIEISFEDLNLLSSIIFNLIQCSN